MDINNIYIDIGNMDIGKSGRLRIRTGGFQTFDGFLSTDFRSESSE